MAFPERLRAIRKARGMSQAQLARASRLGTGTISDLERGKYAAGDVTMAALAGALGAAPEVEAYLRGGGPMPPALPVGVTANAGVSGGAGVPRAEIRRAMALAWDEVADYVVPGGTVPAERVVRVFGVLEDELRLTPPRDGGSTAPTARAAGD